ncbi:MAG: hypothetical protein KKA10_07375 [Euryarchaeota archaeon]|jgi:hypothetical protein|nr:hypothetical protein [Euryarchaeota archaeon]MCG2734917.1 hypothetical protein [Candidatus Methanoperedenaceae archaeon]
MADFDAETIKMKEGQNLMDVLRDALEEKGLADRMDSDRGIFIIDDVTVLSIKDNEVECKVEYEYGG